MVAIDDLLNFYTAFNTAFNCIYHSTHLIWVMSEFHATNFQVQRIAMLTLNAPYCQCCYSTFKTQRNGNRFSSDALSDLTAVSMTTERRDSQMSRVSEEIFPEVTVNIMCETRQKGLVYCRHLSLCCGSGTAEETESVLTNPYRPKRQPRSSMIKEKTPFKGYRHRSPLQNPPSSPSPFFWISLNDRYVYSALPKRVGWGSNPQLFVLGARWLATNQ
jgi:hypothetical protein